MFSSLVPEPDPSLPEQTPPASDLDPVSLTLRWRVAHWGTKWEADQVTVERDSDLLVYRFETAWSAPFAWLEQVSGMFPQLRFILEYQDENSDEDLEGVFLRCLFVDGDVYED